MIMHHGIIFIIARFFYSFNLSRYLTNTKFFMTSRQYQPCDSSHMQPLSSLRDIEKNIVVLNKVTSVSVRTIWHRAPNGFLLVSSISTWGNLPPDSYSIPGWYTLELAANLKHVYGYVLHDHVMKAAHVVSIWKQQAKSIPNSFSTFV